MSSEDSYVCGSASDSVVSAPVGDYNVVGETCYVYGGAGGAYVSIVWVVCAAYAYVDATGVDSDTDTTGQYGDDSDVGECGSVVPSAAGGVNVY